MLRSTSKLRPTLLFGSSWNESVSPNLPGTTGAVVGAKGGNGRAPSTPRRNSEAPGFAAPADALHPCPAVPEAVQFGNWMFMVWPNPMPNIGISTDWTILERSYTSAKPPRITVFLLPITLPSNPPLSGFQANETRGATLP